MKAHDSAANTADTIGSTLAHSNSTTEPACPHPTPLFVKLVEREVRLFRNKSGPTPPAISIDEGYANVFDIIAQAYYGPSTVQATGAGRRSRAEVLHDLIHLAGVCQRLAENMELLPTQMIELGPSSSGPTFTINIKEGSYDAK